LLEEASKLGVQIDGITEWRMVHQETGRPEPGIRFVPRMAQDRGGAMSQQVKSIFDFIYYY
jgi:hypothetical protein